jgi:hypothetical protein
MEPQRPDVVRGSAEFGDSSSLSVHWSVISGFFNWAVGMDSIEKTPTLLDKAGVKMTPHGFRRFRISEWLALGITPTDVS